MNQKITRTQWLLVASGDERGERLVQSERPPQLDAMAQKVDDQKKCSIPECNHRTKARGMCHRHYSQWRYESGANTKRCSVPECENPHNSHGYCQKHLYRWRKNGDPMQRYATPINHHGENNPRWRGGIIVDGHGRTLVYSPGHPFPSYCKSHVYRYRLIMEKHLGRYLLSSEIVHHINGDASDDRLDNLQVMTQSEHMKLHVPNMLKQRRLKKGY